MKKRIFASALLCIALILSALPVGAAGWAGLIDTTKPVALTVKYIYEGTPIEGMNFDIFYVASVDKRCEVFTLQSGFEEYAETLTNLSNLAKLTEDDWGNLAGELDALIRANEVTPFDSGVTGSDGSVSFPSDGKTLEQGLYLVIGYERELDGYTYFAKPTFVMLPTQVPDGDGLKWEYDVTMEPKKERQGDGIKPVSLTVTKMWNNAGVKPNDAHPSQVIVNLFNETGFVETVILNTANNWTHVWNDLDSAHYWFVTETPVSGYTYSVARFGNVFVITNTYVIPPIPPIIPVVTTEPPVTEPPETEPPVTEPPVTETEPPVTETKPPETETEPPVTETQPPVTETEPPLPETTEPETTPEAPPAEEKLPQTGVLWWPVPILAAVGIALIIIGVEVQKKKSV